MKVTVYVNNWVLGILGILCWAGAILAIVFGKHLSLGLLAAGFGLMMFALMIKKDKIRNFGICLSFAVLTISGFMLHFLMGLFFGGVTALLIWANYIADPKVQEENLDKNEHLRLFIVRDILPGYQPGNIVIFEMLSDIEGNQYFSYQGEMDYRFTYGAKFQVDIRKLEEYMDAVTLGSYETKDISYLNPGDFENLSKAAELVFRGIQ